MTGPEGDAGGEVADGLCMTVGEEEVHTHPEEGIEMVRLQGKCRLVGADRLVEIKQHFSHEEAGQVVIPGRLSGSGLESLLILGGRGGVPLELPTPATHEKEQRSARGLEDLAFVV